MHTTRTCGHRRRFFFFDWLAGAINLTSVTPTVAYAQELGFEVAPIEAHVRLEACRYLDPWHNRLRDAYVETMADLGVTTKMGNQEFLDAMAVHKQVDPNDGAATERHQVDGEGRHRQVEAAQPGQVTYNEEWPALKHETWHPTSGPPCWPPAGSGCTARSSRPLPRLADTTSRLARTVLSTPPPALPRWTSCRTRTRATPCRARPGPINRAACDSRAPVVGTYLSRVESGVLVERGSGGMNPAPLSRTSVHPGHVIILTGSPGAGLRIPRHVPAEPIRRPLVQGRRSRFRGSQQHCQERLVGRSLGIDARENIPQSAPIQG
ncbi:hypothetical protein AB5J55_42555 [Streptomyces sp. R11]|uniref:Uncharacterized protein n=1 Tax=Streptomyces sp. R11 TaxID=3238625 RepID=A0AB39ND56_9ACTN